MVNSRKRLARDLIVASTRLDIIASTIIVVLCHHVGNLDMGPISVVKEMPIITRQQRTHPVNKARANN